MSDYQSHNTDAGAGDQGMGSTGMSGTTGAGMTGGTSGGTNQGGTMGRMQDMAHQAMDRMSGSMEGVTDRLRSGVDRMRGMERPDMAVMYDDILEQARLNPGRTILISAAVGMVLGMMMRGNRHDY